MPIRTSPTKRVTKFVTDDVRAELDDQAERDQTSRAAVARRLVLGALRSERHSREEAPTDAA